MIIIVVTLQIITLIIGKIYAKMLFNTLYNFITDLNFQRTRKKPKTLIPIEPEEYKLLKVEF